MRGLFAQNPWGIPGLLTETEIFDCLRDNLKKGEDRCKLLATRPLSGLAFKELRECLHLAEGACRQAAHWRGDVRWAKIAVFLEQAHQMARGWLHRPSTSAKKLFHYLGAALHQMAYDLDRLETLAVGINGVILNAEHAANPLTRIAHMAPRAPGTTLPAGLLSHGRAA